MYKGTWTIVYAKSTPSVIRMTSPKKKEKRIYLIRVPQVVYLVDELILKHIVEFLDGNQKEGVTLLLGILKRVV